MRKHEWESSLTWPEAGKTLKRGELYFLWHPEAEDVFSGCGLVASVLTAPIWEIGGQEAQGKVAIFRA